MKFVVPVKSLFVVAAVTLIGLAVALVLAVFLIGNVTWCPFCRVTLRPHLPQGKPDAAPAPPECGTRTVIPDDGYPGWMHSSYANNSNVPWHVAVFINVRDRHVYAYICGGSILTDRVVLTAAHCVWNAPADTLYPVNHFKVQAGGYRRRYPATREPLPVQALSLTGIHKPDDYPNAEHPLDGDLALLVLSDRIVFTWYIRPICLPAKRDAVPPGDVGHVAGWGYTRNERVFSADLKVMAVLPWIDAATCRASMQDIGLGHLVTEKTVCGGFQKSQSMCPGDDGGGLAMPRKTDDGVERFYVYGVIGNVRVTNPKCDHDVYTVFTSVRYYSEWILAKLNEIHSRGHPGRSHFT